MLDHFVIEGSSNIYDGWLNTIFHRNDRIHFKMTDDSHIQTTVTMVVTSNNYFDQEVMKYMYCRG